MTLGVEREGMGDQVRVVHLVDLMAEALGWKKLDSPPPLTSFFKERIDEERHGEGGVPRGCGGTRPPFDLEIKVC